MKRVPVNLASNPIEHRQLVRRIQTISLVVALVLTALHVALGFSLFDEPVTDAPDVEELAELRYWGSEVEDMVTNADPRAARRVAVSIGLANALIDQRTFPWAALFSVLEETLPDDVRLEIIQPFVTIDGVRLTLTAASASETSLLAFLGALESRPELDRTALRGRAGRPELVAVYPGRQLIGPDGDLRLSIEARAVLADAPALEEPRP